MPIQAPPTRTDFQPVMLGAVSCGAHPAARRPGADAVGDRWRRPYPVRGLVERPALVSRLVHSAAPLVILKAPAGYGKTALLSQWACADARPFTMVVVGERDDDPALLLASVIGGLDDADPLSADLPPAGRTGWHHSGDGLLERLLARLDTDREPIVLALDDAQALRSPAALDTISTIASHLAPGSTVALATRGDVPLPLSRLRAQDSVLELGPRDLAMSTDEAADLLRLAGLAPERLDVAAIVRRTEGWPAALHLAALTMREQPDGEDSPPVLAGDDRILADYLREELLSGLCPSEVELLVHTSPFERLSGDLCDAVLARRGSGPMLQALSRSGLPLAPLDRGDHEFRLHPLVAEALRWELRRGAPRVEPTLHARASAWFEGSGEPGRAIDEAIAAGDVERATALIGRLNPDAALGGRSRMLERWLDGLGDREIAAHPVLAVAAAGGRIARGDRGDAERWTAVAERVLDGEAETGAPLSGATAVLRASIARHGLVRMRLDAARACALTAEESPWRPLACMLEGIALQLTGHGEDAGWWLEQGARHGTGGLAVARALSLAQLGLLALDDGDVDRAADAVDQMLAAVAAGGLHEEPVTALAFAVAAYALARRGRLEEARAHTADARRLMPGLADPPPWYEAELRVALAQAELRLSNPAAAREQLAKASRAARRLPEREVVQRWIDEAWARADTFAAGAASGAAGLTVAELRVLRFLPSHLSFREIAMRLHVSPNTVKTQAHAVYRKLDAVSRSEAVARARAIGLVDG